MDMESFWLYIVLLVIILLAVRFGLRRDKLENVPGPRQLPLFRNTLQLDRIRTYLTFQRWAQLYGGAYRVGLPIGEAIVVSEYKAIHHILVENGKQFAGRRQITLDQHTGTAYAVSNSQPGEAWHQLRKMSHRCMKQFGDGMSRLEEILLTNVDYMLAEFDSSGQQPINTMEIFRSSALMSISVLLLGRALQPGDALFDMLLQYERDFVHVVKMSVGTLLLEVFPWLIHSPFPKFAEIRAFKRLQDKCWKKIANMQVEAKGESLTRVFLDSLKGDSQKSPASPILEEIHVKMSSLHLVVAGVATTSRAMYCILNTMAFRKDIQKKIYSEIKAVLSECEASKISISHRSKMPYLRATILECLRAFTIAPLGGMLHAAISDSDLPGYGVIPKGTSLIINAWTLHHDQSFWQDPAEIRPERFLDQDGNLLPPDHPNRKHLLPFGAGPRVCLGEVFAMTRLFLWTAAIVNKFEITPAPGSDASWINPNVHEGDVVLCPLPTHVIFSRR